LDRAFPAIDVTWPVRPDDAHVERVLAEIDDDHPTALEDRPNGIRVFFSTTIARGLAAARVIGFDAMADVTPVDVPDEQWAERSQAHITAIRVGALTIAPPWDLPAPVDGEPGGAGLIIINPSMGFGTGHHPSTRLCLHLLQEIDAQRLRVLDVGTGSGVLALAAWKRGATRVIGVDCDEDALTSARENVELNAAELVVSLEPRDLGATAAGAAPETFDLVFANLTGGMLTRHAATLASVVAPHGSLIVSGVTRDEEADVRHALVAAGLARASRATEQDWVGLRFTNPNRSTAR
jgi:ribosomal protein L11 methyltransferase